MKPKLILICFASIALACAAEPPPVAEGQAPARIEENTGTPELGFVSQVVQLTNARSSAVAKKLDQLRKAGDLQGLGQIKITADERSNSLLVFASEPDIRKIKRLVSQFDVVSSQILIEAVILEVSL